MARPSEEERTPARLRFPLEPLLEFLTARTPEDPCDTGYKLGHRLGLNTSSSGAPFRVFERGWLTEWQADVWSVRLGVMPWAFWPEWLELGLHPLDRLYRLEEWWRPAWLWAEPTTADLEALEREEAAA